MIAILRSGQIVPWLWNNFINDRWSAIANRKSILTFALHLTLNLNAFKPKTAIKPLWNTTPSYNGGYNNYTTLNWFQDWNNTTQWSIDICSMRDFQTSKNIQIYNLQTILNHYRLSDLIQTLQIYNRLKYQLICILTPQ